MLGVDLLTPHVSILEMNGDSDCLTRPILSRPTAPVTTHQIDPENREIQFELVRLNLSKLC